MFRRLGSIYSRRIVNVNVNIVLAGLLALVPTLGVVHLTGRLLASGFHPTQKVHLSAGACITFVTFVADMIFDVSIYYGLHWLANHSRRRTKRTEQLETIADAAAESVPFFRDATKVQFQRMVLSPLLYLIFLGGQFLLMTAFDVRPVLATVVGFAGALAVARTLHTLWMLRADRLKRSRCAKCGCDIRGLDPARPCPQCGAARLRTAPAVVSPPQPSASPEQGIEPGSRYAVDSKSATPPVGAKVSP
jgi:hypothetical protein